MTTLKVLITEFTESDKYTVTGTVSGLFEEVTPAFFDMILILSGLLKVMKDGRPVPRVMVNEVESGSLMLGSV